MTSSCRKTSTVWWSFNVILTEDRRSKNSRKAFKGFGRNTVTKSMPIILAPKIVPRLDRLYLSVHVVQSDISKLNSLSKGWTDVLSCFETEIRHTMSPGLWNSSMSKFRRKDGSSKFRDTVSSFRPPVYPTVSVFNARPEKENAAAFLVSSSTFFPQENPKNYLFSVSSLILFV